jgi:hypothetical protein
LVETVALTLLSLYLLAVFDAGLSGYRAAAGTNPLVRKQRFYARAVLKALVLGQIAVAISATFIAATVWLSAQPDALTLALTRAARYCLEVYLVYAALTLAAFAFRAVPNRDLRSLSVILILGPFTLVRLPVAILGVLWALWNVARLEVALICAVTLGAMFSLEPILWRSIVNAAASPRGRSQADSPPS